MAELDQGQSEARMEAYFAACAKEGIAAAQAVRTSLREDPTLQHEADALWRVWGGRVQSMPLGDAITVTLALNAAMLTGLAQMVSDDGGRPGAIFVAAEALAIDLLERMEKDGARLMVVEDSGDGDGGKASA